MTETPKSDKLRPCPFTGKGAYRTPAGNIYCDCFSDERVNFHVWQNAHCWKELDKAKAEIEGLKWRIKKRLIDKSSFDELQKKDATLKVVREALVTLVKVSNVNHQNKWVLKEAEKALSQIDETLK